MGKGNKVRPCKWRLRWAVVGVLQIRPGDWQFQGSEPRFRGREDLRDQQVKLHLGAGLRSVWSGQIRVDTSIKRLCFSCQFRTG